MMPRARVAAFGEIATTGGGEHERLQRQQLRTFNLHADATVNTGFIRCSLARALTWPVTLAHTPRWLRTDGVEWVRAILASG